MADVEESAVVVVESNSYPITGVLSSLALRSKEKDGRRWNRRFLVSINFFQNCCDLVNVYIDTRIYCLYFSSIGQTTHLA